MAHHPQVAVIGAGASGLSAAISAAEQGARVVLLEKGPRVGKRLLRTGNGRCNLSNTAIGPGLREGIYHNQPFAAALLSRWDCAALRAWFDERGLLTCADERGWVYPRTRMANSVLDVLRNRLSALGVETRVDWPFAHLEADSDGFRLQNARGERLCARTVILAHGGEALATLRHTEMRPVLGPLHTETAPIKGLDGIRVSVRLTLISDDSSVRDTRDMRDTCDMRDACDTRDTCTSFSEVGELLFRDFGISGIVAFNLSRHARVGDQLAIDFFPEYDLETLTALLRRRGELLGPLTERSYFDGLVHPRIGQLLAATATATTTATTTAATAATSAAAAATTTTSSTFVSASDPQPQALAGALKDWRLRMVGGPRPEQAQVTRGGYAVEDFDPHSLQSCAQPGLYAAGECLDVDGPCGGFNLHWAWVSGIVAGRAAATTASATATTSASAATPSHR